jgi:hypothetical protein
MPLVFDRVLRPYSLSPTAGIQYILSRPTLGLYGNTNLLVNSVRIVLYAVLVETPVAWAISSIVAQPRAFMNSYIF